ncbi:ubiquinol-cytochrome C chaperone family protein [Aquabacter sp. CN5-332]|uniref:ubiquinol-cytochrome C chaperone family protein n=1 Tax=Aquabacter sp. CN5-332 TaxID=3156608 RepID=UPI0032B3F4CB
MFSLFRRHQPQPTIERLYGAIVAQARRPAFYTDFTVPDTIEGRFELLLLHTFLVCHRLKGESEEARAVSQEVFDAFLDDMDRTLREMGVGDLTVPKRMKKIGQAFYGRTAAYDAALAEGADALTLALARNVLEREPADAEAAMLAAYVRESVTKLSATPFADLMRGEALFPIPDSNQDRVHA